MAAQGVLQKDEEVKELVLFLRTPSVCLAHCRVYKDRSLP